MQRLYVHHLLATKLSPATFSITNLCVCSQGAAAYPENEDQQQRLREAAEGLRVATNAAAQNAIKKKLINRLEVSDAAKHTFTHVAPSVTASAIRVKIRSTGNIHKTWH